jgi:thiosulfate dehydrogenase (quinone) large subunit
MSTTQPNLQTSNPGSRSAKLTDENSSHLVGRFALVAIRLSLSWVFLWAFLDKTFGLGHETVRDAAWIRGGSPTKGFLTFAATGPFADLYQGIAGDTWVDWLFMLTLLGIGLALLLGVLMRIAAAAGALLYVLMWSVILPPDNNPFMDTHLIDALVLIALAAFGAGRTWGFSRQWEDVPVVRQNRWLI